MLILSKCLGEYVCHIFARVYLEVVDYCAFVHISTIVITNLNVLSGSLYDSHSDESESSLHVAVD